MPNHPPKEPIHPSSSLDRTEYMKQYREAKRHDGVRRVSVTLDPDEYRALERRAKALGVRPTTLAKELILSQDRQPSTQPEIIRDELQELRFLLRNIANNINQIAHHSNTIRHMVEENDLLLELQKMEKTIFAWATKNR